MKYHSVTTVLLLSATIAVLDEGPGAQVGRERPRTRHGLEDDLECDQIDDYENTGPRHREGCRIKGMVTAGLCWIETRDKAFLLVFYDVVVSAFKFGGN